MLLQGLPYPRPEQIVRVWEQAPNGRRMNFAASNLQDFRSANTTLLNLAGYESWLSPLAGGSEPVRATVASVTESFFATFGVAPARGRTFLPQEERVSGPPAVIVSDRYWGRYLARAVDLAKVPLTIDGVSYSVIGVMPERFDYPPGADVWIAAGRSRETASRRAHNWRVVGRLRDGATIDQARADLGAIAARLRQQYGEDVDLTGVGVVTLFDATVGDVRAALLTLVAAVTLLLLIACANVAGLLLARNAARRKELAVCVALGAGPRRIVQQCLVEALLVAGAAGLSGLVMPAGAVRLLPAILPNDLPRQQAIMIDVPMLVFGLALTVGVVCSLGLFVALRSGGANLRDALAAGSRGYSGRADAQRLRSWLVSGEIAVTLVILVGASLLGRSFLRLVAIDPGFDSRNLVTMELSLARPERQSGPPQEGFIVRQIQLVDESLARLAMVPGVESVGVAGAVPVAAGDNPADGVFVILNGQRPPASLDELSRLWHDRSRVGRADYCVASAGYFRTLGIPLVRGRLFDERDGRGAPHVAVISEALARQRWTNLDPIGQVIEFGNMDYDLTPLTIVGIVGDVRTAGLDGPPTPVVYVDYRQRGINANSTPTIVMRSSASPGEFVPTARGILRDLAPDAPVKITTFDEQMGAWLSNRRFIVLLVGFFAAAALTVAAVGTYGVITYSVTRRTQELGVRLALGAQRADVLALVLGEGARLAGLGVAIGLGVSLATTRLLSSLLFGVSATDPATFAAVAIALSAVALLASYIPARRTLRLDPNHALRNE